MNIVKAHKKLVVYIVLIVASLILPKIITNNYFQMIFDEVLVFIIATIGLNFITGMTGQMNLGTAGLLSMGAYVTGILTTKYNISPWICLIASIFIGYLIGKGLGYPSLRLRGIYLALTTIGFNEIVQLLLTNLSGVTGGTQGIRVSPFSIFGFKITSNEENFYFLFIMFLVMLFIAVKIVHSKWGRMFVAIRDNIDAVESCGIDISDLKIKAFTLASIYGCVAGTLYATLMGFINPTSFSLDLSFNFVIMMMLGGIGTIAGSIIGPIMVTVLPELMRFMQGYYWIIFYSLVLVLSVILPNGLASLGKKFMHLFKLIWTKINKKGGKDIANDTTTR